MEQPVPDPVQAALDYVATYGHTAEELQALRQHQQAEAPYVVALDKDEVLAALDDGMVWAIHMVNLAAEVERLREIMTNPKVGIRRLLVENGTVDMSLESPPYVIQLIGESLLHMIKDAPNYMEAKIIAPATDGQQYVLRVERYSGDTPHELRKQAEEELARCKEGK